MQIRALVAAVIAGVAAWVLTGLWVRWRGSRALPPGHPGSQPPARLEPESRFVVRLSDSEVVCERPDGRVERVGWAGLRRVEIVTTGEGPFSPDVFWVLHGTEDGCVVPQGATGDGALLERLQTLRRKRLRKERASAGGSERCGKPDGSRPSVAAFAAGSGGGPG